jgi:AcrR family transcriptional regulator
VNDSQRRQEILRAAARLVEQYGPAKTTVADVAREAQIGVGTVYLEFASKDAIVEELSRARYSGVLEAMTKAAEQGDRYADRVRAVFDARTSALLRLADGGAHACDLVHCMSPAVAAAKNRFLAGEKALLASLLEQGARAGELRVKDPELLAATLLKAYMAFSPPLLFTLPRDDLRAALRAMHELVLDGLLLRPRP